MSPCACAPVAAKASTASAAPAWIFDIRVLLLGFAGPPRYVKIPGSARSREAHEPTRSAPRPRPRASRPMAVGRTLLQDPQPRGAGGRRRPGEAERRARQAVEGREAGRP